MYMCYSLYVCMYVCMYVCICVCVCVCVCMCESVCARVSFKFLNLFTCLQHKSICMNIFECENFNFTEIGNQ